MIVKIMGLFIKCFIVVINLNDIVLCYLKIGEWVFNVIVVIMLNVMDVSQLNNWLCIEVLIECGYLDKSVICGELVDEEYMQLVMCQLFKEGYISELYVVIVYCVVSYDLELGEIGVFLGIVYFVKFCEMVENVLGMLLSLF